MCLLRIKPESLQIMILWVLLVIAMVSSKHTDDHSLSGRNVCEYEERYKLNVTTYNLKNIIVRNYKWCMNVPPRCSYYTTKTLNESNTVEQDRIRTVKRCCDGFKEDGKICVSRCPKCIQGICDEFDRCYCNPGYEGDDCNRVCDSLHWGQSCKYECICERGDCNPINGACDCPLGWNGSRCELQCPAGHYGKYCEQICSCQSCDIVTGECSLEPLFFTSNYNDTTTTQIFFEHYHSTEETPKLNDSLNEYSTDIPIEQDFFSTEADNLLPMQRSFENDINDKTTRANDEITDRPVAMLITINSKAKVNSLEVGVTSTTESVLLDDDLVNYESIVEDRFIHQDHIPTVDVTDLYLQISIASVATAFILLTGLIIFCTRRHLKKKLKSKNSTKDATVTNGETSPFTNTFFQAPLPEPPVFQNPAFGAPEEMDCFQTFQTNLIFNVTIPEAFRENSITNACNSLECFYDHPPSTGTFKPTKIEIFSYPNNEPIYDEIPTGKLTVPTNSIPMCQNKSCPHYLRNNNIDINK